MAFRHEVRTIFPGEASWPRGLQNLQNPPTSIRVSGHPIPCDRVCVAIVGTRYADEESLDWTYRFASRIASAGGIVVSGGARGVDAAAHRGALDANGFTVAVLASGFDPVFPKENRSLFETISRSGCVLSEREDGTVPYASVFLERNRIVAAISAYVIVVRAPKKSGALSTANWAKQMKRDVYVVPATPWDPRGLGNLALLRKGALMCTGFDDLPFERQRTIEIDREPQSPQEHLSDSEMTVLRALRNRCDFDQLLITTRLEIGTLHAVLWKLERTGHIQNQLGIFSRKTAARDH